MMDLEVPHFRWEDGKSNPGVQRELFDPRVEDDTWKMYFELSRPAEIDETIFEGYASA